MTLAKQRQSILLVLDIDETLIHASEKPLGRRPDFQVFQFHVYCRPHLKNFLNVCTEWYDIGVWSSASDQYVQCIVNEIFPNPEQLHFVWGETRTTTRVTRPVDVHMNSRPLGYYHDRKHLSKLKRFGWPLEKILIVDDSPEKSAQNYGNAIYPKAFEGQKDDDELKFLASYLEQLKDCVNVRQIEKRGWRNSVSPMQW